MSDAAGGSDFEGNGIDMEAAEYVLGTLDLDERLAFAGRLRDSEDLRRVAAGWERRLEAVAGAVGESTPPADAWARIERALFASNAKVAEFKIVEGGRADVDRARAQLEASRNRWRTAALLTGSIAAALVVFVATQFGAKFETRPSPSYIAAVNRGGDKPALIVRVDLKSQKVYVQPVAAEVPPGRSLELWYIDGGKPPKSMGLVQKTPETLTMPGGATSGSTTFAVSVEPTGGSKTGSPTGPVVYSGQLVEQ